MTNKYTVMDKLRNIFCKVRSLTKSDKTVNLRIVVPPLTDRASCINSKVKAEGLCEEYRLTYCLFVCVLILLL